MRMGARHQKIKKESPSLLDKDLLMGDTEAQRRKKRARRSCVFFSASSADKNTQDVLVGEKRRKAKFESMNFLLSKSRSVNSSSPPARRSSQDEDGCLRGES